MIKCKNIYFGSIWKAKMTSKAQLKALGMKFENPLAIWQGSCLLVTLKREVQGFRQDCWASVTNGKLLKGLIKS